jgi:hypothetical protein
MHPRTLLTALVSVLLAASFANAQEDLVNPEFEMTKFGQAGMKFLEIGLSARAEGMGGAVTAVPMGALSMFYNPAGLASSIGPMGDAYVGMTQWFADINLLSFAAAYETPWAVVGVSGMTVDYGQIIGTRMIDQFDWEETGDLDVASSAFGVGAARQVTNKFQIGATVRLVSEDLDATSGEGSKVSTLVWDAGTIYRTGWGSSVLSMSIRNFSTKVRHQDADYELPLIFRIGVSMEMLETFMPNDNHALLVSLDALHPRDRAEEANLGIEYGLMDMLYLRAATRFGNDYTGSDIEHGTAVSLASLGAGVRYKVGPTDLGVNYSWSNKGDLLGSVNRFDVQIGF